MPSGAVGRFSYTLHDAMCALPPAKASSVGQTIGKLSREMIATMIKSEKRREIRIGAHLLYQFEMALREVGDLVLDFSINSGIL